MSEGKVEAVVERTYPITEIAAARTQSATGRVRGKIAIAVP
jgi:NADPH:quinone reductase-like Zn-dependent oxidoreductase